MTSDELKIISRFFDRFVAKFKVDNPEVQRNYDLKVEHTKLVRANSERLAASIEMKAEDQVLAAAIAICHDIGRFPQYRDFGTFNDATSINHAALAVETLKSEGITDSIGEKSRSVLMQSVALHNAFTLPGNLDPEVRQFAMLIRDADKLDIWRVLVEFCSSPPEERASAVTWELPDTGTCSIGALREVTSGKMLNRSLLKTADDFKLLQLSWVFDLNFEESFRMLDEQGYIGELARLMPHHSGCHEAISTVENFVKSRGAEIRGW